jgi:PDZ domain-containing protein
LSNPLTPSLRERITPFRVVVSLVAALVVAVVILLKIPTGDILLLPDIAHPVAPLVHVTGGKPVKGGGELFFVDVQEQDASQFDVLFQGWLHPHSTKVPKAAIIPPGINDQQYQRIALQQMKISKEIAPVVAERQLGYDARLQPLGARVDAVDPKYHAQGILKAGDLIVAVNGTPTLTLEQLHAVVSKLEPGDVASIRIKRDSKLQTVSVKTSLRKGLAIIGINVFQAIKVVLPVKVTIQSGNIGGPSAGLAFTLEVMEKLGADVTHGYKVAATGEMHIDGKVVPIGGVEQKTWGVREAGAQVFLVPAGVNAKTAMKFAGPDLMIIPVTSLEQALHKLARLPKLP